jgi:hypothetical protein
MKNIISYALFGYNQTTHETSFPFYTYLRGLALNVRLARLLFPSWKVRLHVDQRTYDAFERYFELMSNKEWGSIIEIVICEEAPLTKAMLWRLKPAFDPNVERFICRDLDSPLIYKDAQAVYQWVESGKAAHAITASNSHTIPMLGGMVGFTKYFMDKVGYRDWESMVNQMGGYEQKGADQDFLGKFINPCFASTDSSSIMQHYFKGFDPIFKSDGYRTCTCPQLGTHAEDCPLDIDIGIDRELKDSDQICGHIGAAGAYEGPMFKFLNKYWHKFDDLNSIEKNFPEGLFFWHTRPDLIQA